MAKAEKTEKAASSARRVLTPVARASYAHIFKPTTFKKKTSYSITLLFPKKGTDMAPLIKAKNTALREKFGSDKAKWPDNLDNPIRDGDKPKFADKEGYKGHWAVKASATEEYKPGVYDKDGEEIIDGRGLVSGDYVRAQIYAIAWGEGGEDNNGASFLLDGVQLVKKGKPLSARGELKFDPVAGGDDDEDSDDADESDEGEDDEEVDFN